MAVASSLLKNRDAKTQVLARTQYAFSKLANDTIRAGMRGGLRWRMDVFVSHSSRDKAIADAVCARLRVAAFAAGSLPGRCSPACLTAKPSLMRFTTAHHGFASFFQRQQLHSHCEEVERRQPRRDAHPAGACEAVDAGESRRLLIGSVHWLDGL